MQLKRNKQYLNNYFTLCLALSLMAEHIQPVASSSFLGAKRVIIVIIKCAVVSDNCYSVQWKGV